MNNHSHILVVGAAAVDTKGHADGVWRQGTSNSGNIRTCVGGGARNVAENLARLGEKAILLSAVGLGRPGKRVREQAEEAGVDVSYLIETADHRTGAYVAVYDCNGTLVVSIDDMSIMSALTSEVIYNRRGLIHHASMGSGGCQSVAASSRHADARGRQTPGSRQC